jgi:hypothetical protein
MTDHTIDVNIVVDGGMVAQQQNALQAAEMQRAAQAAMIQAAVVERMANAALGGRLGADAAADAEALNEARRVYIMVLSMFAGLAEAGVMDFSVKG